MKSLSFAFALTLLLPAYHGAAQPSAKAYLAALPAPAADASEALERCPELSDTLLARFIDELVLLSGRDTTDATTIRRLHDAALMKSFGKVQRKLEGDILAAGERIDREIRNCPKVRNIDGKEVYQSACVEEAERRGRLQRIAAIDDYLSHVKEQQPAYMREVNAILAASDKNVWLLILHVARERAAMTEMAAQFAR